MAEELAPGIQEMNELQGAGFQATEIEQWRTDTMQELVDAGFSAKETDDYFGEKTPDLSKTEANFKSNLAAKRAAEATSSGPAKREGTPEGGPKIEEADSFIEAIEAGFDMSVTGLIAGKPDTVLPENAEMFYRIASGVGQIAGDIPAMIAGAFVGAPAGAVVAGPAGAVIGAGAGAFAVPEGIRTALMEHYEKGDVQSFSDFWERASAVAISTLKGAVVGGATAGTGGAIGKVVAPALVKKTAQILGEVGVMTTVGAALDGRVPEPMEFVDGTILVGGLHGAVKTASKLRNMYGKTGMRPSEVVEEVKTNGHLRQEIMADNVETPGAKPQKPPEILRSGKSVLEPEVEYSPEVKATLAKIGEQTKSKGKTLKEQASQMYTDRVDKLNPANKMVEILSENPKELPAENNPYIMSRLVPGSDAKARVFFEKGTFEFGAEKKYTGESLNAIYKDVKDTQLLDAYQINLRALEKNKVGIDMGFDIEGAKKVVKDLGPEYHALAKRRTEFSNRVLDYVQAAGVISKESHAAMKKEGLAYLPFKRIAEDAAGGKKGGKAGSLKAVTGSNKNIQNPTLSIAENTVELIKLAEINNAKTKLVELAESVKDQQEIRKVKTPMQEVEVSREEVAKQLGIDVAEADVVTTYRQVYRDLAPNQFSVFKDGKRQVYETTPELAQAMNTLGGDMGSVGTAFKLMQGLTTFKKFALTFTPEFIAKNSFRDWFTGSINSGGKKGINPLDVLGAMGDIWKKNDAYYEMLKSGGAGGSFLDLNNLYLKNNVFKLQGETNFMGSVRNLVSKPIDMMRVAAELSEQSMRLAEFNKARAQGDSKAAAV